MTSKKKISRTGPAKNNGKKGPDDQLQPNNMTVKKKKQIDEEIKAKKHRVYLRIESLVRRYNFEYENCAICGKSPTIAHHENYDLWNSIIFLCHKHHTMIHEDSMHPIKLSKSVVKYTFERSKNDIENIEKLRRHLKSGFYQKSFNTDSEIYREMPDLYFNAVKTIADLQLAIDELTAKQDQMGDLRTCFCRIFEICDMKEER